MPLKAQGKSLEEKPLNTLHAHALFESLCSMQKLFVVKKTEHGIYLAKTKHIATEKGALQKEAVLLPRIYTSGSENLGDMLSVFLYTDSEDRIIATTKTPTAMLHTIARLPIVGSNNYGLFLDIGLAKDIFMPTKSPQHYAKYTHIVVRITRDKMHRLLAKKDITPLLKPCKTKNILHHKVTLWTFKDSKLGISCVVLPYYYEALLYHSTLQGALELFTQYEAKVVKVRDDGKLDVVLLRDTEGLYAKILACNNEGKYFSINEESMQELQMSKKGLKKELSQLLAQKRIVFVPDCGYCSIDSELGMAHIARYTPNVKDSMQSTPKRKHETSKHILPKTKPYTRGIKK